MENGNQALTTIIATIKASNVANHRKLIDFATFDRRNVAKSSQAESEIARRSVNSYMPTRNNETNMDSKKRNILSLIIYLALSCTLIPVGIIKGWSIIEFVIGVASFFISGLILWWNNESTFHRKPNADIRLGYYFLGCFCVAFGAQGLLGCWGEGLSLKGLGAALMIIGAILIRLACYSKSDTKE